MYFTSGRWRNRILGDEAVGGAASLLPEHREVPPNGENDLSAAQLRTGPSNYGHEDGASGLPGEPTISTTSVPATVLALIHSAAGPMVRSYGVRTEGDPSPHSGATH